MKIQVIEREQIEVALGREGVKLADHLTRLQTVAEPEGAAHQIEFAIKRFNRLVTINLPSEIK